MTNPFNLVCLLDVFALSQRTGIPHIVLAEVIDMEFKLLTELVLKLFLFSCLLCEPRAARSLRSPLHSYLKLDGSGYLNVFQVYPDQFICVQGHLQTTLTHNFRIIGVSKVTLVIDDAT